jgi:ABC-type uncharacterized transport system permease subunit
MHIPLEDKEPHQSTSAVIAFYPTLDNLTYKPLMDTAAFDLPFLSAQPVFKFFLFFMFFSLISLFHFYFSFVFFLLHTQAGGHKSQADELAGTKAHTSTNQLQVFFKVKVP